MSLCCAVVSECMGLHALHMKGWLWLTLLRRRKEGLGGSASRPTLMVNFVVSLCVIYLLCPCVLYYICVCKNRRMCLMLRLTEFPLKFVRVEKSLLLWTLRRATVFKNIKMYFLLIACFPSCSNEVKSLKWLIITMFFSDTVCSVQFTGE